MVPGRMKGMIGPRGGEHQLDHPTGSTADKREFRISGRSQRSIAEMWSGRASQSEQARTYGSRVVAVTHRSIRTRSRMILGCQNFRSLAKATTRGRGTKANVLKLSGHGWRRLGPRDESIPPTMLHRRAGRTATRPLCPRMRLTERGNERLGVGRMTPGTARPTSTLHLRQGDTASGRILGRVRSTVGAIGSQPPTQSRLPELV